MFEVGQLVRVKEGLEEGFIGDVYFREDMKEYEGKKCKVKKVIVFSEKTIYKLEGAYKNVDGFITYWSFSEEMLEPVEQKVNRIKDDKLIAAIEKTIEKWEVLLEIEDIYKYENELREITSDVCELCQHFNTKCIKCIMPVSCLNEESPYNRADIPIYSEHNFEVSQQAVREGIAYLQGCLAGLER